MFSGGLRPASLPAAQNLRLSPGKPAERIDSKSVGGKQVWRLRGRQQPSGRVAAEESQRFLCPSSGVEWSVTCCRLYVVFLPFKFCCAMAPSSGEKDCKGPSV